MAPRGASRLSRLRAAGRRLTGPRVAVIGVLCLILGATGCWDQRELDEQLHVLSAFLDLEPDGMLRLTVESLALMGEQGARGGTLHAVFSARGRSIEEAVWEIRWVAEAAPNLAHMQVLVIGEELARRGLRGVLDSLAQNYQIRRGIYVAVSSGLAADLLSAALTSSRHSEQLVGMLRGAGGGAGDVTRVTLNDLMRDAATSGVEAVVAQIILIPPPPVEHVTEHVQGGRMNGGGGEGSEAGPGAVGAAPETPPLAMLSGAGIFQGDRLTALVGRRTAAGLNWLKGRVRNRTLWIPTGPPGEGFTLHVKNSVARLSSEELGGDLELRGRVAMTADVVEFMAAGDMRSPDQVAALAAQSATYIQSEIESALEYAISELGVDAVGFGRHLSRYHPTLWDRYQDRWTEALGQAVIVVEVEVQIIASAMLGAKELGPEQAPRGPTR